MTRVTFFSNYAATALTAKDIEFAELKDLILRTTATTKADLPWLKLATFGNAKSDRNSLRHDANVASISGVELDYDAGAMSLEAAADKLREANLTAILYTSPSYTPEFPKWRVILPTSRNLPPGARARMVARINGLFGGIFANESFALSQAYYYGSVNSNPHHRAAYFDGDYVDLRDDLDAGAIGNEKNRADHVAGEDPEADPKLVAAAAAAIPNDDLDWNDWNKIGMAIWRASGGSEEGYLAFSGFSARSNKKYDATITRERWDHYADSPPTEIGFGTLHYLACAADPHWLAKFDAKLEADLMAANRDAASREAPEVASLADASPEQDAETPQSSAKESEPAEPSTAPVDLWNKFNPPPLPTGLLPEVIEEFSREKARLIGADPSGIAGASLAACAAVISDKIKLKPRRHDSWLSSTRLWVGLVGDPSSKKSPMIYYATKPVSDIDDEMWRRYIADKSRWDALTKQERRTAEPPRQRRLKLMDTTIEAAQEVMRDSPDGVLCVRDELSGWFGSMDKYAGHRGAAMDRAFWLQAYNGGTYGYHRITRGSGMIENLSASVLGGIQPEPMRKICEGTVDDGLIQRIIPIMVAPATVSKDAPTSRAEASYEELISRLHRMSQPFGEFRFDDEAIAIRERLEQRHLELTQCTAFNKKLKGHIGKYDGIFASLCLLWHCIEQTDPPAMVSAWTARRVADFLHGFLLPHALSFYTSIFGLSDDNDRLLDVAGYILAHKVDWVTNRTVQRGTRDMRNLKAWEVENIFHQLEALGWVNRVQGPRMNWPRWSVNPEVHRLFKERGEQEAKRRRHDKEMIIALATGDTA